MAPAHAGRLAAEVERFVVGGFAGQVYRVRLLEVSADDGPVAGLEPGRHYAIKILSPPSGFARLFRNALSATWSRRWRSSSARTPPTGPRSRT